MIYHLLHPMLSPPRLPYKTPRSTVFLLIFLVTVLLIYSGLFAIHLVKNKMSNTFFVMLPSNTTDYPSNKPNQFRVHLPKPLQLTGNYMCALYQIQYPYSWPSTIGTLDEQWIDIKLRDRFGVGDYRSFRITINSASFQTP